MPFRSGWAHLVLSGTQRLSRFSDTWLLCIAKSWLLRRSTHTVLLRQISSLTFMFHDNRKRGLARDESSLLKMAGIFCAKSNLHPIALLACPIFDSVPDHTPPPARIRGAVCANWPYASMLALQADTWDCYQRPIVSLRQYSTESPAMHRHGGGLGELSGLSRQPYLYENCWRCQRLAEVGARVSTTFPMLIIVRKISLVSRRICNLFFVFFRKKINQIITTNYRIINYPGDVCKVLTILQYPSSISAFQHPAFCWFCVYHLPLNLLMLEVQPALTAPESSLKIPQKTLQYGAISDWMFVIVRIIIPT